MKCQTLFLGFLCLVINEIKGRSDLKSSLTFVIDDTGSMRNDISQVKHGANAIFDTVMNSNASQIEDFVLVTFNDPDVALRTVTKNRDDFKNALRRIHVHGGGDCPEMAMAGIKRALEKSRDASLLYVFTDASAKDYDKFAEVEALSQKKMIQVVFVLTGICSTREAEDYLVYHKLAKATSGQVFHLEKSEVGKLLNYVTKTIEGRKNVIASKVFPAGYGNVFDVVVDSHTKELVIAVSGKRPAVEVTDSSGTKVPTEDITRLSETAIIKVLNIKPDVYKVEVGSETDTYVTVSGGTTVHFQHGFSVLKPASISDTASRPMPGEKSYLSIKLSTEGGNVELKTVQILDMDNNIILEELVRLVDKKEQFYITEPIDAPNHMFRIAIKGYDKESKTSLTRISLTPIKPQDPTVIASTPEMAPIVTIDGPDEMDAEYDEPLQLRCKVSGYPAPNVIWQSDDLTGKTTQTDSTIELPSEFISVLDINKVNKNATYTCKAINKLGIGTKSIVVKTKKKTYFNVLELPKDITIEYAKEGQINCKVDAFPPASITWLKNYRPLTTDGNIELSADHSTLYIRSMAPYIEDKYVCEARNPLKRNFTVFQISISGAEPPEINKTTFYVIAMKNTIVDIHCDMIKGKPKPTITWLYNDRYSSSFTDLQYTTDTIHINSLTGDDKPIYRCMAENVVGKDYHDIELVVEYPPEIKKTTSPRIVKNVGETVTLTCPVDGSPTPDIVWKFNGNELLSVTHQLFSDGSIRFKATLEGSGNYECEASNDHGVVRIGTKLEVIIPVNIESPERGTLEVMVGTDQLLPCRADGSPAPVLSWVYHSKDPKIAPKTFSPNPRTGSLALSRIQQEQDGYYTCVAKNAGGSENITYEVIVLASPFIKFTKKQFQAVSGDMMLRVPCYASGNPKPTITWTKNGYNVATGSEWYDMEEDGSLIIKNVDSGSAGSYVCRARNKFGVDNEAFHVIVESHATASFVTNTLAVEEGKPAVVPCSVPHQRTDRVRWFKDSTEVAEGELQLRYVTSRDAGVYTCRVSSFTGAKTGATRVIIGSKPQFIHYNEKESVIEYNEGGTQVMDCSTHGVTKPEVKWFHDGASMDHDELTYILQMYSPSVKGRYTCIVTNEFGSAQQKFIVQTLGCALDIKNDFNDNSPLMLTPKLELPKFEVTDGHVNIPREEYIVLYCPAGFTTLRKREIMVTCENNKEFDYEGTKLLYSDLKCTTKVEATFVKTNQSCNHGSSVLLDIGFHAGKKFVPVYQVCMDGIKTVYSKLNIHPTLANILPNYGFNNEAHRDWNAIFDCNYQNNQITKILGLEFHTSDRCCFEKRQLVNPRDVAPGLSQIATYTALNVVPHWSTCNSKNWDDVEKRIRTLAVTANHELQVWTGVAQNLQLLDTSSTLKDITFRTSRMEQQVPKYLWKVVQDPASKASLAIIHVNVPDLKFNELLKYRHCYDVCGEVRWMQSSYWRDARRGFTYCCSLSEFENKFRYYGEFPPYTKLLKNVDLVSKHYLYV